MECTWLLGYKGIYFGSLPLPGVAESAIFESVAKERFGNVLLPSVGSEKSLRKLQENKMKQTFNIIDICRENITRELCRKAFTALTTCVYPTRSSSSMAHHPVRRATDPALVHRVQVAWQWQGGRCVNVISIIE